MVEVLFVQSVFIPNISFKHLFFSWPVHSRNVCSVDAESTNQPYHMFGTFCCTGCFSKWMSLS